MNLHNPIKLNGQFVDLEPLCEAHREELRTIVQDETIWTYFPQAANGSKFDPWFEKAWQGVSNGEQWVYVIRRKYDRKVVGSSRYYDINTKHRRLLIGYTWYIKEARGTAVNPETKQLLLACAFEQLNVNRVEFTVDSRNLNSRAAVKKLGAIEEGILRQHIILEDGYIRDTVVYSIVKSEWPAIKEKLQARLSQF